MSRLGNITHASVQSPAMTNFFFPVAATALRKLGSSHEFIDVRSMTSCLGNRSVTSGMNGPENESFATVEITVGILNSLAVFAKIWILLNTTRRSCDCTPWYIAGW